MDAIIEVLVYGFLISSLYALAAVGFTMIFGVAGVLNLAHGAFVLIGGYVAVWASTALGWHDRVSEIFTTEVCIPAPGQGALGLEALASRRDVLAALKALAARPAPAAARARGIPRPARAARPCGSAIAAARSSSGR